MLFEDNGKKKDGPRGVKIKENLKEGK